MINALIGKKIEQTQKFLESGRRVPVTMVSLPDNVVVQVKSVEKDGYSAVQLGYGTKRKPTKATAGHAKKAGIEGVPTVLHEVRMDGATVDALPQVGEKIALEMVFKPGDVIDVTGVSKGKGFAGVVKRHNFRGGPKTHGQSDRHRAPGSIGQTTTPGRVYKGKRMAGRMGSDVVTIKNLTVAGIDAENDMLLIAGLVPGHKNIQLFITRTGEDKKFVPLLTLAEPQEEQAQTEESQTIEETPVETTAEPVEETKEEVITEEAAPVEEEVQAEEPKEEEEEEKKEEAK